MPNNVAHHATSVMDITLNLTQLTLLTLPIIYQQEAFEKCSAHSPLRAVLHCHSPGVATVARRLRIDIHDNDDNNDNA